MELVVIVGLAVGLALLIQQFVVKPYQIPSTSMVPTLDKGQRILVERFVYDFEDPEIGDVVVFNPPKGADRNECGVQEKPREACPEGTPEKSDTTFVKRIVAGPGDQLRIEDGHPVVNGEVAEEDFVESCGAQPDCNLPKQIRIPPGQYFMMGDNRGGSQDSRFWGPVPREWIIGQAFATYWPPSKIGIL